VIEPWINPLNVSSSVIPMTGAISAERVRKEGKSGKQWMYLYKKPVINPKSNPIRENNFGYPIKSLRPTILNKLFKSLENKEIQRAARSRNRTDNHLILWINNANSHRLVETNRAE
jgi:hypothetical protein